MVENENTKKFPIFIAIIIAVVVLIFVFVLWQFGAKGIFTVLKYFIIIAVVMLILGLIIFAIFWLFKRHKKEMVHIMRNNIINTSRINKSPINQELCLMGGLPFSERKIGNILGFAVIKSGIKKMYSPNNGGLIELDKPKDVVFVTFSDGGKLKTLFSGYEVFAGIYPDDFKNDLTAPQVYINDEGFGLSPQLYKMLWCSKHWNQKHLIEDTAKETIHRLIIEDNLNNLQDVIMKGVMVDPKEREEKSLAEQMGLDKKIPVQPQ